MTDNLTGLVWTKDAYTPGPYACIPGPAAKYFPWQGAFDYIACLNENSYLGASDWRLPNVNELRSLLDYGQPLKLAPGFLNYLNRGFWTGTTYLDSYPSSQTAALGVEFAAGSSGGLSGKSERMPAWPVRGGQVNKASLPGAPLIGTASPSYGRATVTFSPPADDGGSPIMNYTVTSSPDNKTVTGTSSPITVTGLTNGSTYTFTVAATNAVGTGAASSPSNSVSLTNFPGAPTGLTAFAGDTQATVRFLAPVDNGGSPISSYTVTSNPGNITATGSASPITVSGLTNDITYNFTVTATNASGTGPASSISNAVMPTLPRILINNGDLYTKTAAVTLALNYPGAVTMNVGTNGSSFTGKPQTYSPTKKLTLPAGDGLKTVTVMFVDSMHVQSNFYSASIILDTKAPTNGTLTAVPTTGGISLNWGGFSDATSWISGYRLVAGTMFYPACTATPLYAGTDTSYVHSGVVSGKTYYYRVCAVDNAGKVSTGATAKQKAP